MQRATADAALGLTAEVATHSETYGTSNMPSRRADTGNATPGIGSSHTIDFNIGPARGERADRAANKSLLGQQWATSSNKTCRETASDRVQTKAKKHLRINQIASDRERELKTKKGHLNR
jgi:hypothetical protein